MRVLLIEPDVVQVRNLEAAISREGHIVASARSAQSAVHVADQHHPDVVVMELQLPGHNGIEFLYEFQATLNGWTSQSFCIPSFQFVSLGS